ncbi:MAG TPA: hypothetical protein VFU71_17005, partial [Burkholderiaceae bacterium]|nr:hypothetical protein [Burkholderiaceae bacterium]
MKRRPLVLSALTAGAIAPAFIAHAQQRAKPKLVGYLAMTDPDMTRPVVDALKGRLRDLAWVEGSIAF